MRHSVLDITDIVYRLTELKQGPKTIAQDLNAQGVSITRQAVSQFIRNRLEKKIVWVPKEIS